MYLQLVAASKELKSIVNGFDEETLRKFGHENGFEWSFSAPDAPWMNGVTEALVKSVKKALNTAIGSQVMRFSELQTVLYEASQLVNQRPIGRHPTDPTEGSYLCPNDLLLGRATNTVPQGPFNERATDKYRFDFIQCVVEAFWKKWNRNYFPSLLIQAKWHTARRNLEIGDTVLMQDSNAIRGQWKLGLVSAVHPGSDGRVRRVDVSYKNNSVDEPATRYSGTKYTTVERAVHRLIVLVPVEDNE